MRISSLAILFNGPPLHPSDRVRWRCVCVVITLKCAFLLLLLRAGTIRSRCCSPLHTHTHTHTTAATTLRIVYLCTCERALLLILLLIHVLPFCCNTGPAPDGLTRFSYLLCTGRVARAVSRRHRCSSLLSNGFAAAVVPDLSYANYIYVHIYIVAIHTPNAFDGRRRKRFSETSRAPLCERRTIDASTRIRSRSTEIETRTVHHVPGHKSLQGGVVVVVVGGGWSPGR